MTVHEEFLPQDSQFSQAALKEERREGQGQSRLIELPEESPIHMGYYIEYLYGGKMPTHVLETKSQCHPTINHYYKLIAELYALGERRSDAKYQNVIMRELFRLVKLSNTSPAIRCAKAIYHGTTKESPARRMMFDYAAASPNDYWLEITHDDSDLEFWHDLSKALIRKGRSAGMGAPKVENYLVSENG